MTIKLTEVACRIVLPLSMKTDLGNIHYIWMDVRIDTSLKKLRFSKILLQAEVKASRKGKPCILNRAKNCLYTIKK